MDKNILKLSIGLASVGLLSSACTNQSDDNKEHPNIIMFMVDDMGWQDTSVPFWTQSTLLNRKFHTPNMEILASQGMKFTQAYACAVSSPTRVSLMTGMNAARHRVTNWTLRRDTMSVRPPKGLVMPSWNMNGIAVDTSLNNAVYTPQPLPKVLADNGYETIHCGKAHFGAIGTKASDPLNIGFDVNIAGHAAGAPASYLGTDNFARKKKSVWDVPGLEEFHGQDVFLSEALTRKALDAVDKSVKKGKPFFLYMAHYAVHTPLMADKRFYEKYIQAGYGKQEAMYASLVEGMDKSLGDIMQYLKEKEIDDETIILFMSDNGGLSAVARGGLKHTHNYPLSSGKGSAHEGGIREPMIVKWPGIVEKESVCNEYLIIEDFYPSILEMANIHTNPENTQTIDGLSFVPLLKQMDKPVSDRALFWHYPNNWGPSGPGIGTYSSIRKGDWKLIYYYTDQSFELFNIADDISEQYNLASQKIEQRNRLAKELSDYLRKVNAQRPSFEESGELVPFPDEAI